MKINRELLKGSTSILILKLLDKKDIYGYQITQELKTLSQNAFELKEGTLYPTLHSLEKEEAVESYWFDSDKGRRRKYYKITEHGRQMLISKQKEWDFFSNAMNNVIGGKCHE